MASASTRSPLALACVPQIDTAADVVKATSAMLQAVANGDLTPSEAAELGKLVMAHVEAIKATDHEERLRAIEEKANAA